MPHLKLFSFFETLNISFDIHEHPQLFTVEDGIKFGITLPGANSKNLFLKDRKDDFFLISILAHKRANLKALSKLYGKCGLSFASPEDLQTLLHFGLVHFWA